MASFLTTVQKGARPSPFLAVAQMRARPRYVTALGSLGAFGALQIGSSGDAVVDLQRALNTLGFGPLDEDGDFGPATRSAVKSFQLAAGVASDGVAGPATMAALNAALAAPAGDAGSTAWTTPSFFPGSTQANYVEVNPGAATPASTGPLTSVGNFFRDLLTVATGVVTAKVTQTPAKKPPVKTTTASMLPSATTLALVGGLGVAAYLVMRAPKSAGPATAKAAVNGLSRRLYSKRRRRK